MTQVDSWMTPDPVTIRTDSSALEALEQMTERGFRHLPILDQEERLVGIVSIDDLRSTLPFAVRPTRALSVEERETAREYAVTDFMTYAPRTIAPDAGLAEAAQQLIANRIGCLPVVGADGALVGILSELDALRALISLVPAGERLERVGDLEQLVEELRHERTRLQRQLEQRRESDRAASAEIHDTPTDRPEQAARLSEVYLDETLRERAARRLDAIDAALARAAQHTLGRCARCDASIPTARLRALPATDLCVRCASV